MINVKNIIITNKNKRFMNVIISIISHLGINPKKGGSPPKDKRVINILDLINLLLLYILKVWLMLNNLKLLNINTMFNLKTI